ncbi:MAG TPA: hypothetical protein VGO37_09315 [Steroidobacteraceae bacterium]|jgi:hypothetical protein|nr:hypothetical protein [Steroidobacteraceae bacterium]
MYRKYIFLSMMGIALMGCAATGGQHDNSSPAAPAGAAIAPIAAPPPRLTTPPASAKRLVLNMNGPAAVTEAKDWPAFQEEWRATFADHAKEAGVAFDVQKGEPRATGETGTLLQVYVNDYRMVGIGSRVFFGVMTGNAYIDAKASYTDLNDGKEFGARVYNTTSSAWGGVFAKMTPQQVDAIASKVFGEMAAAR